MPDSRAWYSLMRNGSLRRHRATSQPWALPSGSMTDSSKNLKMTQRTSINRGCSCMVQMGVTRQARVLQITRMNSTRSVTCKVSMLMGKPGVQAIPPEPLCPHRCSDKLAMFPEKLEARNRLSLSSSAVQPKFMPT